MKISSCPNLWVAPYIACDGNVYSCSRKDIVFGNIYRNDLESIWNSDFAKRYREISLKKGLPCLKNCNIPKEILASIKAGDMEAAVTAPMSAVELKIEFSTRCNVRCLMCRQNHDARVFLDVAVLKKNIPLGKVKNILIQGGEFLLLKNARDFFDHLASLGVKPMVFTNGTVMTGLWAKKIARCASFIQFSLNAATKETHEKVNVGSRWESVLGNIMKVLSWRDKIGSKLAIGGHMTVIPHNILEIPMFIKDFRKFGLDCIDFSIDSVSVPPYLSRYPRLKGRLRKTIREMLPKIEKNRVETHGLKWLGLL